MKLSEKITAALAGLPHVKKVWVKGDDFHLTAKAGWEEVEVNGSEDKTEDTRSTKKKSKDSILD